MPETNHICVVQRPTTYVHTLAEELFQTLPIFTYIILISPFANAEN